MTDGGQDFDLGQVVGDAGEKGDDGSTIWYTSTAPSYVNNKYTFTISNLSGKTGLNVAVNDIIFYSTYYYIVSAVNSTTADCTTRINIKGSDASVTIVDNLTSTSSTSVLSAKQGKVLNDNKLDIAQTSYKGKNVVVDSSSGNITFENKPTIPSASSTTPSADISGGSIGSGTTWAKADHQHPLSTAYATSGHTHGNLQSDGSVGTSSNASKNVVTDSNGKITTEAKPTIPTKISDLTNDSDFIEKSSTSGLIKNDGTIDTTSYSTFSGSYTDLSNKPSIPSSSSDLSDGSDLVKTSSTTGLIKNDGTIDTTTYLSSLPSHTHGNLSNDGKIGTNANYIVVTTTGGAITSVQKLGNITYDGKIGSNANYFVYTTTSGQLTTKQKIGNITTSGAIGSTSELPIITTTSGVLTTGSFGSTAGTFAEGNHTHSGYISTSSTAGLVKNDGTIDTNAYLTSSALSNYVQKSNTSGLLKNDGTIDTSTYITSSSLPTIQTSWGSTTSDSKVASEKLIKDSLDAKQASLISGTNIKTINNESLLGSGNITIQGGSGGGGSYINNYYWDNTSKEIVLEYTNTVDPEIVVTSWSSTPSNDNVASEKLVKDSLDDINDLIGDAITYINQ